MDTKVTGQPLIMRAAQPTVYKLLLESLSPLIPSRNVPEVVLAAIVHA
jgi:hypothetical protein